MVSIEIPNLLYRYADLIDAGDFQGAAKLFAQGRLVLGSRIIDSQVEMVQLWKKVVHLYADGTPRTRHLITNPQIELLDEGKRAACRSQWTVLQATVGFPLQVVATGRYADRFRLHEGTWQFEERSYLPIDLEGDLSFHVIHDPRRST